MSVTAIVILLAMSVLVFVRLFKRRRPVETIVQKRARAKALLKAAIEEIERQPDAPALYRASMQGREDAHSGYWVGSVYHDSQGDPHVNKMDKINY